MTQSIISKPDFNDYELELIHGLIEDALDYDSDYTIDTQERLKPIHEKLMKYSQCDKSE